MAYVNFKEERYVAKEQINARKKNNSRIFDETKQLRKLPQEYSVDKEYSYKNFHNEAFGNDKIESIDEFIKISNKDIICSIFKECKFRNIKFENCKFIGCTFFKCNFESGGTIFENCIFIKDESPEKAFLNNRENFSSTFEKCNMHVRFSNSNLNHVIFEECFIHDTSFETSKMISVIITKSEIKKVSVKDCNLSGIKIVGTYMEDFEFDDEDKSKLDEKSFFDKIQIKYKTREEYEGIYMVYQVIADKFEENNLNNNFGEYYYLCKVVQRNTLKPIPRLFSYINCITCGYGERPSYAVVSSTMIIFIFSILYLLIGVNIDGEMIKYTLNSHITLKQLIGYYNESLNLSVGMFAGVGIGNAEPTAMAYMAVNIEMLIGVVMMGIGIGTLTRKLVR